MNRVLISILLLAFTTSAAWAQPHGKGMGPGMRGQSPRMQHAQQNLGLSQEQVDQIGMGQGGPGNRGNRPGRGYGNRADQTPAPGDSSEPGEG